MRPVTTIKDVRKRLTQARQDRDQEAVERISICLARKNVNNTRKNKRKRENKKRNRRMRQEYVASLAAQMSHADDDDDVESLPDPTEFLGEPPCRQGACAAGAVAV